MCKFKYLAKINKSIESIKFIFEILVFVVAGVWSYYHFYESEKAALSTKGKVIVDLKWLPFPNSTEQCYADFNVTIENPKESHRVFKVISIKVELFYVDIKLLINDTFIDYDKLSSGRPVKNCQSEENTPECENGYLIASYAPGEDRFEDFVVKMKASDKKDKFVIFNLTVNAEEEESFFQKLNPWHKKSTWDIKEQDTDHICNFKKDSL